jgi:drug/metabolite transporter (DMT)-like permease
VKYVSPTTIASVPLGEPIIASFFGYLLFQEGIPGAAFIGGPFILLGIYMIINFQKTKVFD